MVQLNVKWGDVLNMVISVKWYSKELCEEKSGSQERLA